MKKKSFILLFLLLFGMLLGICSICYASYPDYDYSAYFDYAIQTFANTVTFSNSSDQIKARTMFSSKITDATKITILTHINDFMSNNNFSLPIQNCTIFVAENNSEFCRFGFLWSNCSSPGSYDLAFPLFSQNRCVRYSTGTLYYTYFLMTYSNGSIYRNTDVIINDSSYFTITLTDATFTLTSEGSSTFWLNSGNVMACGTQLCYAYNPINQTSTTSIVVPRNINGNYISPSSEPEEPSGDSSGDIGAGTGTITNPSGDITGNIDLSGIENGISQVNENLNIIENKIPTSGDIQNVIGIATENYWGSSGDLTGDEQEDIIEDNISNMISSLSGELSQNEVFVELENAENGFLDLFRNHSDDPEYYDLAFEWNDFKYQNVTLIPAGSINISQMCRDNFQLGFLQGFIRIVFNFEVALTLIYQVWNLILATLGIDNPYLYENYNEVDRLDPTTGEVRSILFRRRRHLKR